MSTCSAENQQKMSEFQPPNVFVRRCVPNDHECLFTAIAYLAEVRRFQKITASHFFSLHIVLQGSRFNGAGQRLRLICSEKILSDPETYCEAVLGMPNVQYAEWIKNPFNWGGEVRFMLSKMSLPFQGRPIRLRLVY